MKLLRRWTPISLLFLCNILFRVIYIFYGYIPSEEGFLIYGQKLAYQGNMPFIDYNAWNSLLNNYIVGFFNYFIKPTIISQRFIGLVFSSVVYILTIRIAQRIDKAHIPFLTAGFLTFSSFTFLYFGTVPYSEMTMILSLLISLNLLLDSTKKRFTTYEATFFAIFAALIRPQAIPATIFIWMYLIYENRASVKRAASITLICIVFTLLLYAPFAIRNWDNFWYSLIWPFKSNSILVYQYHDRILDAASLLRYLLELFKDYWLILTGIGAFIAMLLTNFKKTIKQFNADSKYRFLIFSLCIGLSLAGTGLLHKPPYAIYAFPAVPIFSYVIAYAFSIMITQLKKPFLISTIYTFLFLLFVTNVITFHHVDFIKTSLKTIQTTPYSLLQEIHSYLLQHTSTDSEILTFYTPAVVELDRKLPVGINEGDFSISFLSNEIAQKYHLVNNELLINYIASQKAEAIIFTNRSSRSFGLTESEKQAVVDTINKYYYLDRTFDNFSQVANPKLTELYIYLPREK